MHLARQNLLHSYTPIQQSSCGRHTQQTKLFRDRYPGDEGSQQPAVGWPLGPLALDGVHLVDFQLCMQYSVYDGNAVAQCEFK